MGIKYGKIKIELRSDFCPGSGYAWAGVIDSDVSYDAWGIPYVPARRLKGCMREAAELVCGEAVEALFGKSGDDGVKGIVMGNAYIQDYEEIVQELRLLQETGRREAAYLSPQNILKRYTGIRAQTSLEEETKTAKENTLRYMRVVGQYDPRRDGEALAFYAAITYDGALEQELERILKAVRNMGMNRNRGLGSVRCSLVEMQAAEARKAVAGSGSEDARICLSYVLRNQEPLLMSSENAEVSDSCISGKSILGTLAGAYLRLEGTDARSREFEELFLDGSTCFTDANLTFPPGEGKEDAACWGAYYPAPFYLNRLKKTKALVNLLAEAPKETAADYDTRDGNLPKKLKGYFVHEAEPNTYDVAEPEKEILYHNSERELLYSLEAMTAGQYFGGRIYTKRKYGELLKELLEKSNLSFGKSRTAQYGACAMAAQAGIADDVPDVFCAEEGERLAVVFASDGLFLDAAAGYTVRFEEVKRLVAEKLGIPYEQADSGSILQTKEITGYYTVWNLRRPGIPAVKAGSVLVYTIPKGARWERRISPGEAFVGERNLEGYGNVRLVCCKSMAYAAKSAKAAGENPSRRPEEAPEMGVLRSSRDFLVSILTDEILEHLVFSYTQNASALRLSAATVGRLSLMLQDSLNEYRDDPGRAFADFCRRIASIKRARENREAFRLLRELMLKESQDKERYEVDFQKLVGRGDQRLKEAEELLRQHTTAGEYEERLLGIWGTYMEKILAYHKYLKKHEGDSEDEE